MYNPHSNADDANETGPAAGGTGPEDDHERSNQRLRDLALKDRTLRDYPEEERPLDNPTCAVCNRNAIRVRVELCNDQTSKKTYFCECHVHKVSDLHPNPFEPIYSWQSLDAIT